MNRITTQTLGNKDRDLKAEDFDSASPMIPNALNNTWKTVITQEGLLAVKKLLCKTATKNTAVSCHWIRTRSRSELVWVGGSKSKFNFSGLVPVNTTLMAVSMDITGSKPLADQLYANTHLQLLEQYLFALGYVAEHLYTYFYPDKKQMVLAAILAGCLHDIGKIDPQFQTWVTKTKNKDYVVEDGQQVDDKTFSFTPQDIMKYLFFSIHCYTI